MVFNTVLTRAPDLIYEASPTEEQSNVLLQEYPSMSYAGFDNGSKKTKNHQRHFSADASRTRKYSDSNQGLSRSSTSPKDLSTHSNSPSPPRRAKKKSFHQLASNALVNIGSLFSHTSGEGARIRDRRHSLSENDLRTAYSSSSGMLEEGYTKDRTTFNKPWKTRHKVTSNAGNSLWSPKGNCRWISVAGRKVTLPPVKLVDLAEPELAAFKYVSQHKLQTCYLGTPVSIPKDDNFQSNAFKRFRRSFSRRRKSSMSFMFNDREKAEATGQVFGIPLSKAITSSSKSQQAFPQVPQTRTRRTSAPVNIINSKRYGRRRSASNTSSSSTCSNQSDTESGPTSVPTNGHFDDLEYYANMNESASWKSRLIDALTLTSSSSTSPYMMERDPLLKPLPPQVPDFVVKAVEFLEVHALEILGIFRTGGSKKRVKHLRDLIDSGIKTEFDDDDNPHEVAALFKEFFRDLPEPLLTRDLYPAFISTRKLESREEQYQSLKLLIGLLPASSRDTLQYLLQFLDKVADYSEDYISADGKVVPGNRMNARNLATLFGPNILHKVKSQHLHDYLVEDLARAEESNDVIDVVQDLIDNHDSLFEITAEMYDDILRYLLKTDPELVDCILKRFPSNIKPLRCNSEEGSTVSDSFEDSIRRQRDGGLGRALSLPVGSQMDTPTYQNTDKMGFQRSLSAHDRPSPTMRTPSFINALGGDLETGRGIAFQARPLRQFPLPENTIVSSQSAANFAFASRSPRTFAPVSTNKLTYASSRTTSVESEPRSPSISSMSWSNFSTPPQSPRSSSNSTPFYTASSGESSPPCGNSPPRLSPFSDDAPISLVRSILLDEEQISRPKYTAVPKLMNDAHRQQWNQWELMTAENSGASDALEQETLV